MPFRASALALRSQTELRKRVRQLWSRLTQTYEAAYLDQLVNAMPDTIAESHRSTSLMMAAMLLIAASFDLVHGALSETPLLFIAGVLFACSRVVLLNLWNHNPR
jgi:hypothetical protein